MTTPANDLERGYRRLLAWYPRAFRRENEQEILTVLLEGATEGQTRPRLAESADLVRAGLWKRFGPDLPTSARTVLTACRLMYLGALLEAAGLVTFVLTTGSLKASFVRAYPDYTPHLWHVMTALIVAKEIAIPVAFAVWLILAWGNSRGRDWARVAFIALFGLDTLAVVAAVGQREAWYDPANLALSVTVWFIALTSMVLIFSRKSGPYYRHEPVRA
jgi:hypothetical protein